MNSSLGASLRAFLRVLRGSEEVDKEVESLAMSEDVGTSGNSEDAESLGISDDDALGMSGISGISRELVPVPLAGKTAALPLTKGVTK